MPLISCGALGLALFIALQMVKSALCSIIARTAPSATCSVNFPTLVRYLPLLLIVGGVIGTSLLLILRNKIPTDD